MKCQRLLLLAILAGMAQTANAHTGIHAVEGWASGFVHPFLGLDHLLAMLGVGVWAAFLAPSARQAWYLPLAFLAVMLIGGIFGAVGLASISTEIGSALSVLAAGLAIAGMLRYSRPAAMALVGLFALFHGLAHGAEIGPGVDFFAYATGFVCATGLLHGIGIWLGYRLAPFALAYRSTGVVIGGLGVFLLMHAI